MREGLVGFHQKVGRTDHIQSKLKSKGCGLSSYVSEPCVIYVLKGRGL